MNVPRFFGGVVKVPSERITRAHSEALCRKIEEVWHACGHKNVKAWVKVTPYWSRNRAGELIQSETDAIASNLVNGLPPQKPMRRAA
jgi:hypothetical protein